MLSKQEIDSIREEAEKEYPITNRNPYERQSQTSRRKAYIKGRTAERINHLEYQQKVEKVLTYIISQLTGEPSEENAADALIAAEDLLSSLTNKT